MYPLANTVVNLNVDMIGRIDPTRREKNREQSQGKILSFDDADLIKKLTGIKNIKSLDFLGNDLVSTGLINGTIPVSYTHLTLPTKRIV